MGSSVLKYQNMRLEGILNSIYSNLSLNNSGAMVRHLGLALAMKNFTRNPLSRPVFHKLFFFAAAPLIMGSYNRDIRHLPSLPL